MSTPTSPTFAPVVINTLSTDSSTFYWNDSTKSVDFSLNKISLIITKSDIILPIQYINHDITIYNDSSATINLHIPDTEGTFKTPAPIDTKKFKIVKYLSIDTPEVIS